MSVDTQVPGEEQVEEFKEKASHYLDDIKVALESTFSTRTFQFIFSGSAVERYGIPLMYSHKPAYCITCFASSKLDALDTDLDVMFCSVADTACINGQGNILVEPIVAEGVGLTGYARLTSITPGFEGTCFSSKFIRDQAKIAVANARVSNLPGIPGCCGVEQPPKIQLDSKGPAMKVRILPIFEADITLCIHCADWPTISDWSSRPRYWPSTVDAQRIMSLGCHLVAKPAPNDKEKTSWRFSFSVAEVELSKLVPETARKCFLALKIILKDHLQPVVPEISSYHIKTIFLNTLEKLPVGFWVEDNLEECFMTLLVELRDALISMKCPHHWFSFINLFSIKAGNLNLLVRKVERILKDPAPFIFDDGCFCLSPCCVRVPQKKFIRRGSQQFRNDYDEVYISVDADVITQVQNPLHNSFQSPGCQTASSSTSPEQLVVTVTPRVNRPEQEITLCHIEANVESCKEPIPLETLDSPYHDAT